MSAFAQPWDEQLGFPPRRTYGKQGMRAALADTSEDQPVSGGDIVLGARELQNPGNVSARWDEEGFAPTRTPTGTSLQSIPTRAAPTYDTSNPDPAQVLTGDMREASTNRVDDDAQSRNANFLNNAASDANSLRMSIAKQSNPVLQQMETQPTDHQKWLKDQYDQVSAPSPKPSLGRRVLGGIVGAMASLNPEYSQQQLQKQEFQQNQQRERQGSLLNAIEEENRTQEMQRAADKRWDAYMNRPQPTKPSLLDQVHERQQAGSELGLTGDALTQYGLTGQMPKPDKPVEDRHVDSYVGTDGRQREIFQKPTGETYERTFGNVRHDNKPNPDDRNRNKLADEQYGKAMDADARLDRMESSYQKALNGDQQAMLALLTDHVGMTLGMQKGARITKDILQEATQSQPWLSRLAARFDDRGYLSGVTLGPDQMRQMLDLGYEARNRQWGEAQGTSQLYGIPEPPGAKAQYGKRDPNKRIYQQGGRQAPSGATHIVPGPDGKNHYTNATGTVDLGVAQ